MKKLLLLLLLIPNLVMAGFDVQGALDEGYSQEEIDAFISSQEKDAKIRLQCAKEAGKAKTEYAAQRIEYACLTKNNVSRFPPQD